MALTSCENEAMNEGIETNDTVTMTFVAGAPESRTSVDVDTYTDENGKQIAKYSWSTGDKVGFYKVANGIDSSVENYKEKNNDIATIEGETATFTPSFKTATGATNYNIGAFYPSDSWVAHADENHFNNVKAKIATGQTLTKGTFDPNADLMIAYPFMGIALDNDETKTLNFHRIAAIGKMNLKLTSMEDGEVIKYVKFSFAEGTQFTGEVSLDMENTEYTKTEGKTHNYVELTGELTANAEGTAIFFTCFPGEYNGTYTIDVKTDKATYTKTSELSKALKFTEGNVLGFNATVGNRYVEVLEENEVVDVLNLTFTGRPATQTYGEWSGKTGASGAVYAGQSAGDKSSIQLRSKNNNSGIVTTTSGGTVKKVVVTWHSETVDGRTLNIYGKKTAYSAATDLYDTNKQGTELGTIVKGTSTELVIDGEYEFIGMRSNDGAIYLSQIEITWATGTSEGGNEGGETPETPKDVELKFTVSNTTIENTEHYATIPVELNEYTGEWLIDATTPEDDKWIYVQWEEDNSGVYYIVEANDTESSRETTVTLYATNSTKEVFKTFTITQNAAEGVIEAITIEEFLEKEVNFNTYYKLTGKITNIANATFGNFDIEDETASVYVYGLTKEKLVNTPNDKSFGNLGLKVGDVVTICAIRSEYNGTIQAGGTNGSNSNAYPAYYISHYGFTATATSTSIEAAGGETTITLASVGDLPGAIAFTKDGDANVVLNDNTATVTYGENSNTEARSTTITFTCGLATQTITITQAAKVVEPEQPGGGEIALGAKYSYDVTAKVWSNWGTGAKCGNYTWIPNKVSVNGSPTVGSKDGSGRGQQFGAANTNQIKTMTMTCKDYSGGVNSISVKACAKSGNTITVSVTVGGVEMQSAKSAATISGSNSSSIATLNFTSDTVLTGDIVITYTLKNAGALYVSGFGIN